MKVKNIVFSGFAAAILMGVAADASADTHVVTKGYIDSLDSTVSIDQGAYASGVKQVDGKVTGVTARPFDQTISENSTHDNAPTSKAVHDYVTANDTTYTAGDHITIDTANGNAIAVNDVTNLGTDIDANDTGLTTGKAVHEYVTNAVNGVEYSGDDTYITVDNTNNEIELTNITSEAAGITGTSTALTTGKAVYDYVTANDTTYTAGSHITIDTANGNAITVDDVTNLGTDINGNDTGLTTGKAVSEYVTTAVNGIEYSGDDYITVDNDNNDIELTNVTNVAGGIVAGNTELTTANAVFEYVQALTGGVLPQGCDNGNCALVKLNGALQWVNLTTPVQDQTTGG